MIKERTKLDLYNITKIERDSPPFRNKPKPTPFVIPNSFLNLNIKASKPLREGTSEGTSPMKAGAPHLLYEDHKVNRCCPR